MIDTATVLARPEVQSAIADLIVAGAIHFGVKPSHAWEMGDRYRAGLIEGRPLVSAIAIVDVVRQAIEVDIRAATLAEASNVVDRARAWAEGDLRGVRDRLRMMARDPKMVDRDEWDAAEEAADAEDAAESQRENGGAGEAGGLLNSPPTHRITINGEPYYFAPTIIGYDDVVKLSGRKVDRVWSITYHNAVAGENSKESGILVRDCTVTVKDGTRFSIADTSNA